MKRLLAWISERGGIIERFPGGFWSVRPFGQHKTWGTSSVEALVRRGKLSYTEWQTNKTGSFPVAARLAPHGFLSGRAAPRCAQGDAQARQRRCGT